MATNFEQDTIHTKYEGPFQGKEDFPEHELGTKELGSKNNGGRKHRAI